MGSIIRPSLFAAPLLLAAPVHAQQTQEQAPGFQLPPTSSAPAPNPNQQGPELDVYRDPATPRATPPVVVPPAVTPTVVTPTVTRPAATVQPMPRPDRPRPAPAPSPAEPRPNRPVERATPPPAPATSPPVAAEPAVDSEAANATMPAASQPLPPPVADATNASEPVSPPAPATADEDGSLPWIIGGAVALIALAAAFFLRRRRSVRPPVKLPATVPAPAPSRAADTPPAPDPSASLHAPATAPAATAGRPWIDMDMAVAQARYSLMGVTIAYRLILHNRGDRPAQDVLVRGMLGNGGARQQAVLQGFFTGQDGLPIHNAVSIAPGETVQMTGELRLTPDQIVPVDMGQRSLLIPLAAFDAAYRWGAEDGDLIGQGRTARAFIVGQEQEPPADRLAPLRLDQGPRQYRRPAARAAAELTPA